MLVEETSVLVIIFSGRSARWVCCVPIRSRATLFEKVVRALYLSISLGIVNIIIISKHRERAVATPNIKLERWVVTKLDTMQWWNSWEHSQHFLARRQETCPI